MIASTRESVWLICICVIGLCLHQASSFNPCCSFPCQNNGVCVADGDSYSCDCTRTGYYGVDCETPYWSTWLKEKIKPTPDTMHYLLTNYNWFWWIINNVGFIRDPLMRVVYNSRLELVTVPHVHTSDHEYATLEAYYNRSYYARTLPPVPKDCPTPFGVAGKKNPPSPEELAEKFLKRREFIPDHVNTSLLFMFFAQHFTHQFFKTEYKKSPALTWGRHGIDVSHIYGQGVETENILRTFKDGKLKSQIINGEEWPPYVKDANVTMHYPPGMPDEGKFALGHPFFSLLPGLFLYSTIWLREHNRVCGILKKEHPHWGDEQLYQTAKLIIAGELIQIVVVDYINHLANYNLKLIYKPDLLFGQDFHYDNRIHVEFNHVYHWHPFNPDEYNVSGTIYSVDDTIFHPEIAIKHGMRDFVDSLSRSLAGKVAQHNHGKYTLKVGVDVLKHQRQLRLQSFNNYRKRFQLRPYTSFEDLTGETELAAELEKAYGDVDAVDLYLGFFMEKRVHGSPFGITFVTTGAPYSFRGIFSHPVSSPEYWKPSTFGGELGFDMVKTASLEKLFCLNIKGECPLVAFRVPVELAREARKAMSDKKSQSKVPHEEL